MQKNDLERPIWKVLPLHPQPKPLEALSGYILRLAEANGLKSVNELAHLSGLRSGWRDLRLAPDYSDFPTGKLAWIAGCLPDNLRDMTFYHLARHFACPTHSFGKMSAFLERSVASSLRYCPACLAEQPYHPLGFRFLALAGCYKHRCSLLSECGHCGASIPLLPRRPRVACCATCQGDLRTCPMLPLPQQAEVHLEKRAHDLELLLMPAEQVPEITSALLQGDGFLLLRQRKHLSLTQATHLMGRDEQVVTEMEEGNWRGKATLADYWRYTEILGSSLTDVVEAARTMRSSENKRGLSRHDERAWLRLSEVAEALRLSLAKRPHEMSDPTHL
jgi:TniQ protein